MKGAKRGQHKVLLAGKRLPQTEEESWTSDRPWGPEEGPQAGVQDSRTTSPHKQEPPEQGSVHRGSKTRGGTLPGRGRPPCREMLQSGGVQQPESRGGDAPQSQGGKTPQSEVPHPLERGPPIQWRLQPPEESNDFGRGPGRDAQEKGASRSPEGGPLRQVVPRTPREVTSEPRATCALTQRQAAGGAHDSPEAVHQRVLLAVRLPHHLALQDLSLPGPRLLGHGCGGNYAGTGTGRGRWRRPGAPGRPRTRAGRERD